MNIKPNQPTYCALHGGAKNENWFPLVLALALLAVRSEAATVTFTTDTVINAGTLTYENQDLVVSNCTLTVNGAHAFNSLWVTNGAVLTHSAAPSGETNNRLDLTIAQNMVVDAASAINVSGRGYGQEQGPGKAGNGYSGGGGGGGYGGNGGNASGYGGGAYGSILTPTDFGSGGGGGYGPSGGGAGGGFVRLTIGGTLTLNGTLTANGVSGDYWGGGGAGGSIYLNAATLLGSGLISARGGDSPGSAGGGGGGRIAIYYNTSTFSGGRSAIGGTGSQAGGAGTIYTKAANQTAGDLLVDNGGQDGLTTPITTPVPFNLTIVSNAIVYSSGPLTNGNLTIKTNGLLTHLSGQAGLNVTVLTNVVIELGGRMDVTGKGYGQELGDGRGINGYGNGGGGGAYGGNGGNAASAGGSAYGSIMIPTDLGSGGGGGYGPSGGGAGGGAILLVVGQTLTVNGQLLAEGAPAAGTYGGGGSGGSLKMAVGWLAGAGLISTRGGTAGGGAGGGSGGRIAIYYGTNNFSGVVSASGGSGAQYGGAGTVYAKMASHSVGDLTIDNGGQSGAFTPLTTTEAFNLTLSGNATVYPQSALTVSSLIVKTNTLITHLSGQANLSVTVWGNVVIEAGGRMDVSGKGYGQEVGAGKGINGYGNGGGGGAYGGNGGNAASAGGSAYGSITMPTDLGSGGGGGYGPSFGGAGGGAIMLVVGQTLTVNGHLLAEGASAAGAYGGGGAGGSLNITVGWLAGTGLVSTRGGVAGGGAGGGSGGRIAIYHGTNNFAGVVSASGGGGGSQGGAGTIYTKRGANLRGLVVIDNGGNGGGLTRLNTAHWPAQTDFDLTVSGAALVYPDMPMIVGNLRVIDGGQLSHAAGQSGFHVIASENAEFSGPNAINVTGRGYGPDTGPGAGGYGYGNGGGGGGHGGVGGTAAGAGGGTYDSLMAPVALGSGGGSGYGPTIGSAGGGAIRLTVAGTVTLNSLWSADGNISQGYYGGAGAGGSIYLMAGALNGTGLITAQGGIASGYNGGGGGRIAIHCGNIATSIMTNLTNGIVSGGMSAGAGTLFISNTVPFQVIGQLPSRSVSGPTQLDLYFNQAVQTNTFTSSDVVITTPSGTVAQNQITITPLAAQLFRITFPAQPNQSQVDVYQVQIGPHIQNLSGQELAVAYQGSLTSALVRISGTVRTTNGTPVSGLTLLVSGGPSSGTTDLNGVYTNILVPIGWSGTVTPVLSGGIFTPASNAYVNASADLVTQDYTMNGFPPAVASGPQSLTVSVGSNLTFSATVSGTAPFSYQWYYNGGPLANGGRVSGVNSNILSLANAQTNDIGNYFVSVTNAFGGTNSSVATLLVNRLNQTITFTNWLVKSVGDAPFLLTATASSGLTVGYSSDNPAVATVTNNLVTIVGGGTANLTASQPGDATYNPATPVVRTLTVASLPAITRQPTNQIPPIGGLARFEVVANSSTPMTYQWYFNNLLIPGATDWRLDVGSFSALWAGSYICVLSNTVGTVTSAVAGAWLPTLEMYAGVNLYGPVGSTCRVDYATNLNEPVFWHVLTNFTLSTSPQVFIDYTSPGTTKRFYRTVPLP